MSASRRCKKGEVWEEGGLGGCCRKSLAMFANSGPSTAPVLTGMWQGRCWDVGMSRNGWLRMIPSHDIQMWSKDSAHRLFYPLPAETAFDVETRLQMRNNDSSCLSAGLYIKGEVNSTGSIDEGGLTLEWLTIGLLDFGDDALLQWNAKAEVLDQAIGLKARDATSEAYLRMVRDGDGGVRAFWKRDRDSEWTPAEPKVYFDYESIEVGIYAADCGPRGNATVDFEYFRDNVKSSFTRTFHHRGEAGVVVERSGGAAGEVVLDGAAGDDAVTAGPAKTLSGAVTRAASLKANATLLTLLVVPGVYSASRLDAMGAQQVIISPFLVAIRSLHQSLVPPLGYDIFHPHV